LLACFVVVFSGAAQPSTSSNRFLFIVDTSLAMRPFADAVRETMFDLIYSGVRTHMTNGDTYGVWLVADQNDTSFPMETWKSRHAVEGGARVTMHLKERAYKGRARFDVALADATRVVKNIGDLTVVLVSNGETPIAGTPFDAEINAQFRELAPKMKRAKATLNTALVARDGAFVAWAVNSPEYLIEVPSVAPKPKPAKVELVVKTNAPAPAAPAIAKATPATVPVAADSPVFVKPRATGTPIVITRETVAQEKREFQSMTAAAISNEPPVPPATNTVAVAAPAKMTMAAAPTNSPTATTSNVITTSARSQPVLAPQTNPPVAVEPPPAEILVTNAVVAAAPSSPVAPTKGSARPFPPPAAPREGTGLRPMMWIGFGAGATFLLILAGFLFGRSRRHEPSLISQALVQQRLEHPRT